MIYPLVGELAAEEIPVVVSLRVSNLAKSGYYRWLASPVTSSELVEAYRANALYNAHIADPEFGYRLLAAQARKPASPASQWQNISAWKITSANQWWCVFGKKRTRSNKKPGPTVHDDYWVIKDSEGHIRHQFTADKPNQLWLTDITEHSTTNQGKVYLCAIKDVFANRIVGYSIETRMTAQLAVKALNNAVQRRRMAAGCVVHSDRGSWVP